MAENQVEEVKSRTDIVAIIGERVELKKAGRNYKALCPFHGEKTPSFMVSPELQIFKCFGCGEAGDVFAFLEKYEGMEFPEALKYLADRAGVKLQKFQGGLVSEKEKLIDINTQAMRFYNYLLLNHLVGKRPLEYLQKERGLKKQTIEEFQIGFSPESSYSLKKYLVDRKKFSIYDVEKAGIGIVRGQSLYDRFNGRIIFPLFDHRGNPVGFSGRILPWDKRETGKYINSPETPLYHKSNVLYGLNLTRGFIKKKRTAIVVEGELDLISSWQAGIKNVVAIKGSALTEEQVRLLSRFAQKFILALDADLAGDAATRRGIKVASDLGVEIKIAEIGGGYKDPDDAVRGNLEGYKKDLIGAKVIWDFLIDSVFGRNDAKTGSGKAKISKEITPILSEIGDKIVQAHYTNVVATKLGVPLDAVTEEIAKVEKASVSVSGGATEKMEERTKREVLEENFLRLVFASDSKILLEKGISTIIKLPFNLRLVEEYREFSSKKEFNISEFGRALPKELFEGFSKIVLGLDPDLDKNPEGLGKELELVKKELKILAVKEKLEVVGSQMREMEEKGEKGKLLEAQNKFNKLAKLRSTYEKEAGGGIILNEE
jgi:DNA primase